MVTTPSGDWKQRASVYSGAWIYWHGAIDEDAGTAQCFVRYRQPTAAGNAPVIDYVSTGCWRWLFEFFPAFQELHQFIVDGDEALG